MLLLRSYHAFGLAVALGSALSAATHEVAQQNPQASDEPPGTAERPWKTIAKAKKALREHGFQDLDDLMNKLSSQFESLKTM